MTHFRRLNRLFLVWFVCVAFQWLPNFAFAAKELDANQSIAAIREIQVAAMTSRSGVSSGKGHGTLRKHDGNGALVENLDFDVEFAGPRFRLDLVYKDVDKPRKVDYDRRVLLKDGADLFALKFSKRITPAGCESAVFECDPERVVQAMMDATAGSFMYDLSNLGSVLLGNPHDLDKYEIAVTQEDAGDLIFRFMLTPQVAVEFVAAAAFGNNIVKVAATNGPKAEISGGVIYRADWELIGGVWCIRKLERSVEKEGQAESREVLEYEELQVNVPVDEEQLNLASLPICDGSRVLDHRPKSVDRVLKFTNEADLKKSVAEAVSQLPSTPAARPPDPLDDGRVQQRSRFWVWLLGVNGLIVLLVGLILMRRHKRRRA